MRLPDWSLLTALLVLGGSLVAWNVSRFLDAKAVIRMDPHLEFLPSPAVARALSLGHTNSVAKLRWIDGFAHLSYQMDHGSEDSDTTGLRRYYHTLIALDPHFPSYYEHAATVLGGLKGDVHGELYFDALGLHHNPESTRLWAAFVAALSVHYRLEERFPEQMEAILQRWGEIERTKEFGNEHFPGDWLAALARRHARGLEQLAYWGRLLLVSSDTAPQADVARRVMREQLARHHLTRLEALVAAWVERHGAQPEDLAAVLELETLSAVYPRPSDAIHPAEPITMDADGGYRLRSDPYGSPYLLDAGAVASAGLELANATRRINRVNSRLRREAIDRGRWPNSLEQAAEWVAAPLPEAPEGSELRIEDGQLVVVADHDPTPWTDGELLAAAGLNPAADRP